MNIEIEKVRCHNEFSCQLPNEGLILFDGESGAGKTTLLNSIAFAFTNLKFLSGPNKSRVCIKTSDFEVEKTKSPQRLVVVTALARMYDDEAQVWLNEHVGLSMVSQNGSDQFLLASAYERRNQLEKIVSFDSAECARIDQTLNQQCQQTQKCHAAATVAFEFLTRQISKCDEGSFNAQAAAELAECEKKLIATKVVFETQSLQEKLFKKMNQAKEAKANIEMLLTGADERAKKFVDWTRWQQKIELEACLLKDVGQCELEVNELKYIEQRIKQDEHKYQRALETLESLSKLAKPTVSCPACCAELIFESNQLKVCLLQNCGSKKRTYRQSVEYDELFIFCKEFEKLLSKRRADQLPLRQRQLEKHKYAENELVKFKDQRESTFVDVAIVDRDCQLRKELEQHETTLAVLGNQSQNQEIVSEKDVFEFEKTFQKLQLMVRQHEKNVIFEKMHCELLLAKENLGEAQAKKSRATILSQLWLDAKTTCIKIACDVLEERVNLMCRQLFQGMNINFFSSNVFLQRFKCYLIIHKIRV